jgi:hypothetical protein
LAASFGISIGPSARHSPSALQPFSPS